MRSSSRAAMRRELVRSTIDFVFVLALFWAILPTNATGYALLSLSAAGMATVNLAFLRHLRRVYASPRRGVWRRA